MDTYVPVVSIVTVQMPLAIVASVDMELDQMDVVTAFLYGDLDEDIFNELKDSETSNVLTYFENC